MDLRRLVLRNILGGGARSAAILLGAALVAGFALIATMVVRGAEANLLRSLQRLGADIVVFPWGTRLEEMQGGHLMQITSSGWIPRSYVGRIRGIEGVTSASPQLYLATLKGSPYIATAEAYLVAFEPETDFALSSWLDPAAYRDLAEGQAVVGSHILDADGTGMIDVDGYVLQMAGQLAPTGTDLDETVFVNFETARAMSQRARGRQDALVRVSPQRVTTALVRVAPGQNVRDVAVRIMEGVPGTISIESARMLQAQRGQIVGLMGAVLGLMGVIWALAIAFIGLVFTMTVHARRRQIGVLAALGAPPAFIVRSLLTEGAVLGLAGGGAGIVLAAIGGWIISRGIAERLELPFAFPSPLALAGLAAGGLLLGLVSVVLGALAPALRISRAEPAQTMRE